MHGLVFPLCPVQDHDLTFRMSNETNMQALLYTYSPLTVSANAISWQDYIGK